MMAFQAWAELASMASGRPQSRLSAHHVPDGRLGDVVVEGEDLLGDGVNFAARLNGSMSIPAGTERRHLRKSQRVLQQPVRAAERAGLLDHPDCAQHRTARIAQAVRKGALGGHLLGDRDLPITCRQSSPCT
jgi:hypothetical protein